jgi:hypothetical protein
MSGQAMKPGGTTRHWVNGSMGNEGRDIPNPSLPIDPLPFLLLSTLHSWYNQTHEMDLSFSSF